MEYVDGFPLCEIGPSLEPSQKARLLAEVAEALQRAHDLGLQHRDMKPAHVLVDAALRPHLLDFGLSGSDPRRGHGRGTLAYMAPEQLDPAAPIDARTDVYALGVVLYELVAGRLPYAAPDEAGLVAAIRRGEPDLPAEHSVGVPEPLQAIALQAMARDPRDRYLTAQEMAADLRRFAEGRPVLARPIAYRTALERRMAPHIEDVAEWERLRLIYSHEAERLRAAYHRLTAREGDWILGSRTLSLAQVALYLGAFLLGSGGLFYFVAYLENAAGGLLHPALCLGVPVVLLSCIALRLDRGELKAAGVAYHLAASAVLVPLLLITLRESALFTVVQKQSEIFEKVTNRQLQVALFAASLWAARLAMRTRTVALSSGFTLLLLSLHLAFLGDRGLVSWVLEEHWDSLGASLAPLVLFSAAMAFALERRGHGFFAQPLYVLAGIVLVTSLTLVAQNGRAFAHLGLTLAPMAGSKVTDLHLLDTVGAMTTNGILFFVTAVLLDRHGTPILRQLGGLLEAISPFAVLEPLVWLSETGEYSRRFDWMLLALALAVTLASRFRQRRSFFTAGLVNTGVALVLLADHYEWFDNRVWALAVLASGGVTLLLGLALERRQSRQTAPTR